MFAPSLEGLRPYLQQCRRASTAPSPSSSPDFFPLRALCVSARVSGDGSLPPACQPQQSEGSASLLSLATNVFRIRTSAKSAHNSFRIRTSKTQHLKPFRIRTYEKNPRGGAGGTAIPGRPLSDLEKTGHGSWTNAQRATFTICLRASAHDACPDPVGASPRHPFLSATHELPVTRHPALLPIHYPQLPLRPNISLATNRDGGRLHTWKRGGLK